MFVCDYLKEKFYLFIKIIFLRISEDVTGNNLNNLKSCNKEGRAFDYNNKFFGKVAWLFGARTKLVIVK